MLLHKAQSVHNRAGMLKGRKNLSLTQHGQYITQYAVSGPALIGCRPGNLGSDEGGLTPDALFITITVKHRG